MAETVAQTFEGFARRMIALCGLDRWEFKFAVDGEAEETASCSAMPEYQVATIRLNPDKLQTGDELDELAAHEAVAHPTTWALSEVAEEYGMALAECAPEPMRLALGKLHREQVRKAEEICATMVGRAIVTLCRKLWAAEAALAEAQKEARALKKLTKDAA